ncbi:MAG: glycosyltransferase family 4 protein [Ilumatobacteraceae bacterium]
MDGQPLRIGIVCPYSLSLPGGVQGQVLDLARVLRRMGHEARVLGPCDGPPPEVYVTPLGNSLPTAANGSVAPLAPDPACTLRTIRTLRDEEFDVVHVHEPYVPGPPQTTVILDVAPLVATFHAAGESAAYRYLQGMIRHFASNVDINCAVSKDAAELVRRYVPGDYRIVFNGVDVPKFRDALPHPAVAPTIFFCGRHEPRKGLEQLLTAMSELPADVRLWIASDGPDTARLMAAFAGDHRVEWLGRISEDEKIARLKSASVFCAPSLHGESFGVVLLEAMAAGTPVVASDLPGYLNVARPDVDAAIVPAGDVGALAGALRRILRDGDEAQRMAVGAAARAEEFSMERLAELYLGLYREAIDARASQPHPRSRTRRAVRRMMDSVMPNAGLTSFSKELR